MAKINMAKVKDRLKKFLPIAKAFAAGTSNTTDDLIVEIIERLIGDDEKLKAVMDGEAPAPDDDE